MLSIKDLSFSYGKSPVIENLTLSVQAGELLALTGLSGSGKSTLLKLIYGILAPEKGSIHWKEKALLGPNYNLLPGAPFLRYLAQDFDLMPYTTVSENISHHLTVFEPRKRKQRTQELLALINLEAFAQTKVALLSGGQQQRVALAKVLAKAPELLLLDEPFSHIDQPLKFKLRAQLFTYLKKHGISCILASHHPEDYLGHAHQMVCLEKGCITAKGSPKTLYNYPPTAAVAGLLGLVNVLIAAEVKLLFPSLVVPYAKKLLVWPHEWEVGKKGIHVQVTEVFFKGNRFLIKSKTTLDTLVYFESPKPLEKNKMYDIGISKVLCQQRLNAFKTP